MEEDAWLMKIETKREEPVNTIKGDKGKEATVDPSPVTAQALLAEEEEEASSPPKENWVSGMGTPLGFRQAWGRCPGIVSSHYLFAFTYLSSIFCLDE